MNTEYTIRLNRQDLGQLLDGLEVRASAWRNTALYLSSGELPTPDFVAEECSDADEVQRLAEHYDRIIASVLEQKAHQE